MKIQSELDALQRNIEAAVQTIESDPIVQYCMTGREVQGMRTSQDNTRTVINRGEEIVGRFPDLTTQTKLMIATSALKTAKDNYYEKYDELNEKMMEDYVTIAERIAEVKNENAKDARRDAAQLACINLAEGTSLPTASMSEEIDASSVGYVGSKQVNDWNYKETVTTTFSPETLICHKCIRKQTCDDPIKKVMRKKSYCKTWSEETETCTDIQF